jgi:ribosome-associated toxin RatA of RatAB toxin-antitoxin module
MRAVRQIDRHALVPFSAAQMYALVDDIARYPQFLPWCKSAVELQRSPAEVLAKLEIHKGALNSSFTTRNLCQPHDSIKMLLVEGPFRELQGEWRFTNIGDKGSRVQLQLRFAFAHAWNGWLLEPVFEHTCNTLIDAFVQRARAIYG